MIASFPVRFFGAAGERQHVIGRLQPAVDPGIRIIQKFVKFCFLLVQYRFLSCKFFLADLARGTHVDESVNLSQTRVVVFLLVGEDRVAVGSLPAVCILQPAHRPGVKFRRRLHFGERFRHLAFKLLYFDTFLTARSFAFGAVIVGVVVDVAVLVTLGLILGRDHASAFSAANHACVRERVRFGLRLAASAKERLYAVVLLACDHRFVFALVPVA